MKQIKVNARYAAKVQGQMTKVKVTRITEFRSSFGLGPRKVYEFVDLNTGKHWTTHTDKKFRTLLSYLVR